MIIRKHDVNEHQSLQMVVQRLYIQNVDVGCSGKVFTKG
jgi:hypothetical protein